jgi:hypothetical protein
MQSINMNGKLLRRTWIKFNEFIISLSKKYPSLTPKDIKLCVYLKMNLTSKEIAQWWIFPIVELNYIDTDYAKVAIITRGKPIQVFIINIKIFFLHIIFFSSICNRITIHQYYIIVAEGNYFGDLTPIIHWFVSHLM